MLNAYPKPIYDQSRIDEWSNDITQAIAVDGEITNAAAYLKPSENGIPSSAVQLFETLIQTTKDMAGANETALGDTSVTKTASGILRCRRLPQCACDGAEKVPAVGGGHRAYLAGLLAGGIRRGADIAD
jgi:hypothetical protein